MTGLIVMAMLVSVTGAPAESATVGTTTATGASVERIALPPARLKRPGDLLEDRPQASWRAETTRKAQATSSKRSTTAAKVLGVAIGAVGGFYGGGMAGYYLAQDKNADDDGVSGLKGVVIGAPIGAAVGALIGYQIAK